jgi:hypothetical protein
MSFTVPFIGRTGQRYVKTEGQANYGVSPTLGATDAVRVLEIDLAYNPNQRTNAMDRNLTPGVRRRQSHKTVAGFNLKRMAMWPSGTLGTPPESDVLLTNALGAKQAIAPLSTTVTAGTVPSTTQMTLAAVTGLVANRSWVEINIASLGINCVRFVTAIATNLITVAPPLPTAPATSDTVKSGVDYYPATNPASAFTVADYLTVGAGSSPQTFSREVNGCIVESMGFTFDPNNEPEMSFAGPGKTQPDSAQAQPGAFTTVGTVIPPGTEGSLRIGSTAVPFLKASIQLTNGMKLRNTEYGSKSATGFWRAGRRSVVVSIDMYAEDRTVVYDNAISAAGLSALFQLGTTEGKQWGLYLPKMEFDVPSTPDPESEIIWTMKAVALETNGNDELYLGQL